MSDETRELHRIMSADEGGPYEVVYWPAYGYL
jgi:hypothetical protein